MSSTSFSILLTLLFTAGVYAQAVRVRVAGTPEQQQTSQPKPDSQQVKPEDRCIVEGAVVNAKTGEPLKKVRVMLSRSGEPGDPMAAVTDATGRYKLAEVDPGRYNIYAFKSGFARQQFGERRAGQAPSVITLVARQNLRNVDFKLLPAAVVIGRVVDEDGEPLARVRIQALRWRYMQGRRDLISSGYASTDDQGRYRMFDLSEGRYYFSATYDDPRIQMGIPDRSGAESAQGDQGYAPLYYPGTIDSSQAAPIRLQSGEERTGLDFILTPTRTVRIRGRIVNLPAGNTQGTYLTAWPAQSGGWGVYSRSGARVNRDGSFEVRGLTPGSYVLTAFASDEEDRISARRRVEVGASNVEGIELTLQSGFEIKGVLRLQGESDPKVSLQGLSVFLRPLEMSPMMGGGGGSVRADGTFVIKGVLEGDYRVGVSRLPQNGYLKAAKLGDTEVLEKGISITEGSAAAALELVISTAAGTVTGVVLDDKKSSVSGASAVLVPESGRRTQTDLFKMAVADQNGHFSISGVAPGDYKLFAWDQVEMGAYQDPEFLKPFESKGKAVTIRENGSETVELPMLAAEQPAQ